MTPLFKKYGVSSIIAVFGTALLIGVWIINGAEREDLWLYIFSIWLVLFSAYIALPKKDKNKDQ